MQFRPSQNESPKWTDRLKRHSQPQFKTQYRDVGIADDNESLSSMGSSSFGMIIDSKTINPKLNRYSTIEFDSSSTSSSFVNNNRGENDGDIYEKDLKSRKQKFEPHQSDKNLWTKPQSKSGRTKSTKSIEKLSQNTEKPEAEIHRVINEIRAGARKSTSKSPEISTSDKPKAQFYYGEEPKDTGDFSSNVSYNGAIDKVKTNVAISHPQNIVVKPGYKMKEYVNPMEKQGKPVFAFGDTPPLKPKQTEEPIIEREERRKSREKSTEPKIEKDEKRRSRRKSEEKKERKSSKKLDKTRNNTANIEDFVSKDVEKESEPVTPIIVDYKRKPKVEINKSLSDLSAKQAFEAELMAGKMKLKKASTNESTLNSTGSSLDRGTTPESSEGATPSPPPPPPPIGFGNTEKSKPIIGKSNSIIEPPKMPAVVLRKTEVNKKKHVSSGSGDGRGDLLAAIRNAGGIGALRKTGSKHL